MSSQNWIAQLLKKRSIIKSIPTVNNIKNQQIILFGAGKGGEAAFQKIRRTRLGIKILDIFDNDSGKWGKQCMGMIVKSPVALNNYGKESIILVSSMYFAEIAKQINDLGFTKVYDYHMLFPLHSNSFFDRTIIEKNLSNIERLESILDDEASKIVLKAIIEYRLTLQSNGLLSCKTENQYFPDDLIQLSDNEVFVDAGSFIGTTAIDFAQRTRGKYQKIICFEPDKQNFDRLEANIQAHQLQRVQTLNFGAYDSEKELMFTSNNETCSASHISDKGTVSIKTVLIDNILHDEAISFIKMDIEGAEIAALKGAMTKITEFKPTLAICVYHLPTDLWQIPLMLNTWVPEYKIYLRSHSGGILETVCYAVKVQ